MSRFQAVPCIWRGVRFDSMLEMEFVRAWIEHNGGLRLQDGRVFTSNNGPKLATRIPPLYLTPTVKWKVDFVVNEPDGSLYYMEFKGAVTAEFKIKRDLWRDFGPARLQVWRFDKAHFYLQETILKGGYVIQKLAGVPAPTIPVDEGDKLWFPLVVEEKPAKPKAPKAKKPTEPKEPKNEEDRERPNGSTWGRRRTFQVASTPWGADQPGTREVPKGQPRAARAAIQGYRCPRSEASGGDLSGGRGLLEDQADLRGIYGPDGGLPQGLAGGDQCDD